MTTTLPADEIAVTGARSRSSASAASGLYSLPMGVREGLSSGCGRVGCARAATDCRRNLVKQRAAAAGIDGGALREFAETILSSC